MKPIQHLYSIFKYCMGVWSIYRDIISIVYIDTTTVLERPRVRIDIQVLVTLRVFSKPSKTYNFSVDFANNLSKTLSPSSKQFRSF